jgi:hypothetical protein
MPIAVPNVRSQGQSRKHVLALSFSGFDPTRTLVPGRTAAYDAAMMDIQLPEPGVRLEQRARRAATDGYPGGGCRRL